MHAAANPRVRAAEMSHGRARLLVMRDPGDARVTVPVNLDDAEGAFVDRRRPGPASSPAFDEAEELGVPGGTARGPGPSLVGGPGRVGGSRQRASEATSRARFAADNAATGRHHAEEPSIAAPPGPRGALFNPRAGLRLGRSLGMGRGRRLKLEGRRQATLYPWIGWRSKDRRPVGVGSLRPLLTVWPPARGDRRSTRVGIGWSVRGARGRKSVAEVGERHLSPRGLGVHAERARR